MKITGEWIIEYYFNKEWKISGANNFTISGEVLGRIFEEAVIISKHLTNRSGYRTSIYRMRNKYTGDIIPAAML